MLPGFASYVPLNVSLCVSRILDSYGVLVKRQCTELLNRINVAADATGSGQKTIRLAKIPQVNGPPPLLPMDDEPRFVGL